MPTVMHLKKVKKPDEGEARLPWVSSGLKVADAAISAVPCFFGGITVFADGTNPITIRLYDDPDSADGTCVFAAYVPGASAGVTFSAPYPGVRCDNGLYLDMTASGGVSGCVVYTR